MNKEEYKALREGYSKQVIEKLDEITEILKRFKEEVGDEIKDANHVSLYVNLEEGNKQILVFRDRAADRDNRYVMYADVVSGETYPDGIIPPKHFIGED